MMMMMMMIIGAGLLCRVLSWRLQCRQYSCRVILSWYWGRSLMEIMDGGVIVVLCISLVVTWFVLQQPALGRFAGLLIGERIYCNVVI